MDYPYVYAFCLRVALVRVGYAFYLISLLTVCVFRGTVCTQLVSIDRKSSKLLSIFTCTQGFKQHALHDVLESPGDVDLTADMDFGAIKRAVLTEGKPVCIVRHRWVYPV